jgi:hypothetical protein
MNVAKQNKDTGAQLREIVQREARKLEQDDGFIERQDVIAGLEEIIRACFEATEQIEINVWAYHDLYIFFADRFEYLKAAALRDMLFNSKENLTEKEKKDNFENYFNGFERLKFRLDVIFYEYLAKIENVTTGQLLESQNEIKKIIGDLSNNEETGLSEMLKRLGEINTKVTKPKKPQWIQEAIEEGQLEKDGKTLRVSADDMAHWLFTYGVEGVDTNFMINNFRLRMKHSTAQQAVSRGKPEHLK